MNLKVQANEILSMEDSTFKTGMNKLVTVATQEHTEMGLSKQVGDDQSYKRLRSFKESIQGGSPRAKKAFDRCVYTGRGWRAAGENQSVVPLQLDCG